MAYRNREQGILTWNNLAAEYLGGKLSDNQWGVVIRVSDRVTLQDFEIVGSSKIFKDHTVARSLNLCSSSSWRHEGLILPSAIWQTGPTDPGFGLRLRNVNISGFDMEKQWYPNCKSTEVSTVALESNVLLCCCYVTSAHMPTFTHMCCMFATTGYCH
jgi:hypothetical protein